MANFKRVLSMVLSVAMLLTFASFPAFAETTPKMNLVADVEQVNAGETVSITIEIENNPGVTALMPIISYDESAFDVVTVEGVDQDDNPMITPDYIVERNFRNPMASATFFVDGDNGDFNFTYVPTNANATDKNGAFVTFEFVAKDGVNGVYEFSIKEPANGMIAANMVGTEEIPVTFALGSVNVTVGTPASSEEPVSSEAASSEAASSEEPASSEATSSEATSSTPDSSETDVFETPKTVQMQPSLDFDGVETGPSFFARPTNNLYVGDTLRFEGVTLSGTPKKDGSTLTALQIVVTDKFLYRYALADGVTAFYAAIDANNVVTGLYPTLADANAGTNKLAGYTFASAGKYAVVIRNGYVGTTEKQLSTNNWIDNYAHNGNPIKFFLDIMAEPTGDPTVEAPEVPAGIATAVETLEGTDFVTDVSASNFNEDNNRYYLVKSQSPTSEGKPFEASPVKSNTKQVAFIEAARLDFTTKTYVEEITINLMSTYSYIKYDVFGSLDGENWYPIVLDGVSDNRTLSANKGVHAIDINGVAKYFRVDFRDLYQHWGLLDNPGVELKFVDAAQDVDNFVASSNVIDLVVNAEGTAFKVPDGVEVEIGDTLRFDTTQVLDMGTYLGNSTVVSIDKVNVARRASGSAEWNWNYITSDNTQSGYTESLKTSGTFTITEYGEYQGQVVQWGAEGNKEHKWLENFSVIDPNASSEEPVSSEAASSEEPASSEATSSEATSSEVTSSMPNVFETPKTVQMQPTKGMDGTYTGPTFFERPTNNLYVGDTLRFEGVTLSGTPKKDGSTLTALQIIVIDKFIWRNCHTNGVNAFYAAIDANNVVTGLYPTLADANAGTNKLAGVTFSSAGKYAVVIRNGYAGTTEIKLSSQNWIDNYAQNGNPIKFFLDVKAAPTGDPTVTAPEVPTGVAGSTQKLQASDFVTDVSASNFNEDNNRYYLVKSQSQASDAAPFVDSPVKSNTKQVAFVEAARLDFTTKTYVKDITIELMSTFAYIKYDVFGSLDGENWYPLVIDGVSDNSALSANKGVHTITINGVAKYFRVDFRDLYQHWGLLDNPGVALKSVNATQDVDNFDPTSSEATSSEATSSEATSSEATSSEATSSEATSSEATSSEATSSEATSSEATSSEIVTPPVTNIFDTPKTVQMLPSKSVVVNHSGTSFFERPTNNLYVGDTLKFDGIKLAASPEKNGTLTALQIIITKEFFWRGSHIDGVNAFYAAIDADANVTGLYPTIEDAVAGTNKLVGATLTQAGKYAVIIRNGYIGKSEVQLSSQNWIDNAAHNENPIRFYFDVMEAPSGAATVYAPGYSEDVKNSTEKLTSEDFVTDVKSADFNEDNNRFYLIKTMSNGSIFVETNIKAATIKVPAFYAEALRLDFATNTYVKDITFSMASQRNYIKYDVFGSLDGENWYPIVLDGVSNGTNGNHTITFDGTAKYFRFDFRDLYEHFGFIGDKDTYAVTLKTVNATQDIDIVDTTEEIRKNSYEVLSKPQKEVRISDTLGKFTLSFDVKAVREEAPDFTFFSDAEANNEITPLSEVVTLVSNDGDVYYYTVQATFAATGEVNTVYVIYGSTNDYRFETGKPESYTVTLSSEIFGGDIFEGENAFYASAYQIQPKQTIKLYLQTQRMTDDVLVVDGVEYTNVKMDVAKITSLGSRTDYADKETDFHYDEENSLWYGYVTAKKDGIDQFMATIELIGYNTQTKETEVIEVREIQTEIITVKTPPKTESWGSVVGGKPGSDNFNKTIAELKADYADKDYVLVDMSDPSKLTYFTDAPYNRQVSAEFWNELKNMNKSRIIFRAFYEYWDGTYTEFKENGDTYTSVSRKLIYEIEINKEDHSMIDMQSGKKFKVAVDSYYPTDKATGSSDDTANNVKAALGFGYAPYFVNLSTGWENVPFTKATWRVEVAPFWYTVNGWQNCTLYKVNTLDGGGASVSKKSTDVELTSLYTATDVPFQYDKSQPIFSRYFEYVSNEGTTIMPIVIVGEDLSVERTNQTDKNNVATGGADMTAAFAVFTVVALGALAIKKRK